MREVLLQCWNLRDFDNFQRNFGTRYLPHCIFRELTKDRNTVERWKTGTSHSSLTKDRAIYSPSHGGNTWHRVVFNVGLQKLSSFRDQFQTCVCIPSTLPRLAQWGRCCRKVGFLGTRHPKAFPWTTQRKKHGSRKLYNRYLTLISVRKPETYAQIFEAYNSWSIKQR